MKEEFLKAVRNHDLPIVRLSLANQLLYDPNGTSFAEMLKYAENNLPDLYEEDDNREVKEPPVEQWDKAYLIQAKDALDMNFSRKKLAYFMAVVSVVMKNVKSNDSEQQNHSQDQSSDHDHNDSTNTSEHLDIDKMKIGAAMAFGGGALGIIGLVASKTLAAVLGGVVLIGGIALIVTEKNK